MRKAGNWEGATAWERFRCMAAGHGTPGAQAPRGAPLAPQGVAHLFGRARGSARTTPQPFLETVLGKTSPRGTRSLRQGPGGTPSLRGDGREGSPPHAPAAPGHRLPPSPKGEQPTPPKGCEERGRPLPKIIIIKIKGAALPAPSARSSPASAAQSRRSSRRSAMVAQSPSPPATLVPVLRGPRRRDGDTGGGHRDTGTGSEAFTRPGWGETEAALPHPAQK